MRTTKTFANTQPRKINKHDTPESYKTAKPRKESPKSEKTTGFWSKVRNALS